MNGWGRIVTAFYILVVGSLNGVFAAVIAALGAKEGEGTNLLQGIWELYGSSEDRSSCSLSRSTSRSSR